MKARRSRTPLRWIAASLARPSITVSIVLAGLCSPSVAGTFSGNAGFAFLNVPPGARATAMGQAFAAVPGDIQSMAYNPASLATIHETQASFQQLSYVEGISQQSLAFGRPIYDDPRAFRWAVAANYFHVGGIERTVATGLETGEGYVQTGDFSTYDLMLQGTAAKGVTERFTVGWSVKLLRESLGDASANAGALDVGAFYYGRGFVPWTAGASINNIGFSSKFADAAVGLPLGVRLGASIHPLPIVLVSADYTRRRDTEGELDGGIEITPIEVVSVRLGYRYQARRPDYGTLSDFSAGLGLRWKAAHLDYAFVPLGDLGYTHRVTLTLRLPSRHA